MKSNFVWNKQSEYSIFDSINDWEYHRFACVMSDGTLDEFSGLLDENYNGEFNLNVDSISDKYSVDDIVMWIEIPQ